MTKRAENFAITGWVIALVATLGSLYFSEVQQYPPCELCWVQRIFMYPLVLILLVGTLLKDTKVFIYSIVFSSIGLIISDLSLWDIKSWSSYGLLLRAVDKFLVLEPTLIG